MATLRKVSDAEANYLKELMAHIVELLDSQREMVISATANTSLEYGVTTTFSIEVTCIGNQVIKP